MFTDHDDDDDFGLVGGAPPRCFLTSASKSSPTRSGGVFGVGRGNSISSADAPSVKKTLGTLPAYSCAHESRVLTSLCSKLKSLRLSQVAPVRALVSPSRARSSTVSSFALNPSHRQHPGLV